MALAIQIGVIASSMVAAIVFAFLGTWLWQDRLSEKAQRRWVLGTVMVALCIPFFAIAFIDSPTEDLLRASDLRRWTAPCVMPMITFAALSAVLAGLGPLVLFQNSIQKRMAKSELKQALRWFASEHYEEAGHAAQEASLGLAKIGSDVDARRATLLERLSRLLAALRQPGQTPENMARRLNDLYHLKDELDHFPTANREQIIEKNFVQHSNDAIQREINRLRERIVDLGIAEVLMPFQRLELRTGEGGTDHSMLRFVAAMHAGLTAPRLFTRINLLGQTVEHAAEFKEKDIPLPFPSLLKAKGTDIKAALSYVVAELDAAIPRSGMTGKASLVSSPATPEATDPRIVQLQALGQMPLAFQIATRCIELALDRDLPGMSSPQTRIQEISRSQV